jgi:hypothetical protein
VSAALDMILAFWLIIVACALTTAGIAILGRALGWVLDTILRATERPRGATRRPRPTDR